MIRLPSSLRKEYAIEAFVDTLSKLPDPDFVLEKQGVGREHLRKMESDDDLSAALETRREALVATPWRLDPYEGENSAWLAQQFETHIDSFLRAAWSAVPYGYSVIEVVYKIDGDRVAIDYVAEKPFEWFEPKRDGRLLLRLPGGGEGFVETGVKFFLTRRNATYRNPYGDPLLSKAYWPWFFRHNLWRFWMQYLERFADPLLMGQVIDADAFLRAMQNQGFGAVVAVDREDSISALTQSSSGEFVKVEDAVLSRYHRLVLGQTLTSDIGDYGSFAAAKVHDSVRDDKRRADIRLVAGAVQELVNALWALNRFPGKPPLFIMQDATGLEIKRAERDAMLVNANIVRFTPEYLRSKYSLEDGEFEVPAAVAADPINDVTQMQAAGKVSIKDGQVATDALATATARAAQDPLPQQTLIDVVLSAESPDDLAVKLADLYLGSDPAEFRTLLDRAIFAADVVGFAAAKKDRE